MSVKGLFGLLVTKLAWPRQHSQAFDFERLGLGSVAWQATASEGTNQTSRKCWYSIKRNDKK
jgi:hypothetical protein